MADDKKGVIRSASDGGVSGEHAAAEPFEFLVGPATTDQFNTATLPLIPIACWRVDDIRFSFDSSFVNADPASDDPNDIRADLLHLLELVKAHPGSPLSVFGHADPVGSDDYNKALSGRRSTVIYGLLICNTEPDKAVQLWQEVAKQENWGPKQKQAMQSFTGLPSGSTGSALIKAYLQKLMPPEFKLGSKDFLAQGTDAKGKGDYQGCSEFNPTLIFSKQKNDNFEKQKDKTLRNDANAQNRRVMVLLFRKGSKIDPAKWPCPRSSEGIAGCKKRFWSDGETRRSKRLPDQDRTFKETQDTFACRFYQRLLTGSPCEEPVSQLRIRLFDRQARPLPGAPCLIVVPGKDPKPGRASGTAGQPAPLIPPPSTPSPANATGGDDTNSAYIVIPNNDIPSTVHLKWSRPRNGDGPNTPLPKLTDQFDFEMDVVTDISESDESKAAMTRLTNLGYVQGPVAPEDDIRAFQIEYKARFGDIVVDGTLNTATKNAIKAVHDACNPVLKGPRNTPL